MQTQLSLTSVYFAGSDYNPDLDDERLTGQLLRVFSIMQDGTWRTLQEIQTETYKKKLAEAENPETVVPDPESSISAQLRHLRKDRFGLHTINKKPRGDRKAGLWEYQLQVNPDTTPRFPDYWTLTTLRKRGWTKELIELLLEQADEIEDNPHASLGAPMQLFLVKRVLAAEKCPEFKHP